MKWLSLLAVTLAACTSQKEAGLLIVVTVPANATSKCLQLELAAGGSSRTSGPVPLAGKTTVSIGAAQGSLPDTVELRALGFSDEGCQMRAREESMAKSATFAKNQVQRIELTLVASTPRTESTCDDGLDEDRDGLIDCADRDCDNQPCRGLALCIAGTRCSQGMCAGGQPKQCMTPPTTCFEQAGVCAMSDGGCVYTVSSTATCSDFDSCTTQDRCSTTGACMGTPITCAQSTNACLESAGSCADGGCTFAARTDAGCDDGNNCTIDDRCSSGGQCAGSQVQCEARTCRSVANRCNADGGCVFDLVDAGTSCDGGICSRAGDCLARFPYQPSNFDPTQLRAPPSAPTVLDCGETIIDTTGLTPTLTNWCRNQDFPAVTIPQQGGPDAVLVTLAGLTLTPDAGLIIVGDKPLIFGVLGDVVITGTITARAGSIVCTAGRGLDGEAISGANSGGSGAGFATNGGRGGAAERLPPFNSTSETLPGQAEQQQGAVPLRGGCRGGRGGATMLSAAEGGGAFQVSASGTMSLAGIASAPGRGGTGAPSSGLGIPTGGNGGGSGGLLVFEANELTVSGGRLSANGGAGGQGGGSQAAGDTGSDGTTDATSAPATTGSVLAGGNGGAGGAQSPPTAGGNHPTAAGGGGGGSAGRIVLRGASMCSLSLGVVVSPSAVCP